MDNRLSAITRGIKRMKTSKGGKKTAARVRSGVRAVSRGMKYASASYGYLASMVEPGITGSAYIPDAQALPSLKVTARARTEVQLAAGDAMFLFPTPNASSDRPQFYVFTGPAATLDSVGFTTTNSAITVGGVNANNLPFSLAVLEATPIQYRGVSGVLRLSYTGRHLDRCGMVTCYNCPSRLGVVDDSDDATIIGLIVAAARAKHHCRFHPIANSPVAELVYHPGLHSSAGNVPSGKGEWLNCKDGTVPQADLEQTNLTTSIAVTGATGHNRYVPNSFMYYSNNADVATSFHIECVLNIEYHGGPATSMHTPSPPDLQGSAQVTQAISHAVLSHHRNPTASFKDVVLQTAKESGNQLVAAAGAALKKKASSWLTTGLTTMAAAIL